MARSLHSSEQNMWSQNLRYDERKRGTVHEDVRMIAYSALATVAVRCVVCLLADTMESRGARRPSLLLQESLFFTSIYPITLETSLT